MAAPPSTKIVNGKSVALPTPESAGRSARHRCAIARPVLGENPRVQIMSPRVQGSINLKGARIDDLVLTDHRETIAKNSPPVRLLSPGGAQDAYFAQFRLERPGRAAARRQHRLDRQRQPPDAGNAR